MIYIVSPYKTCTHTVLASLIYNEEFPTKEIHDKIMSVNNIPENKMPQYIQRSHVDYDHIKYIFDNDCDSTVISVVRDPISQYISGYFYDISSPPINYGDKDKILSSSMEKLTQYFNSINFSVLEPYSSEIMFRMYRDAWGFNIYDDQYKNIFDKSLGYGIYNIKNNYGCNIKLIIIRADKLNNCLNDMANIFNLSSLPLVNSNIADEKWYIDIYKEFKHFIKTTKSITYMEYYVNQPYVKQFYTTEEIDNMANYNTI